MRDIDIIKNISQIYRIYFQDKSVNYKVSFLNTSHWLYFYDKTHEKYVESNGSKLLNLQDIINNRWNK